VIIQGLNSDLVVGRDRYHVQTENIGDNLITLVFKGGAVVARAKQKIAAVEGPGKPEKIRKLMKAQHDLMIGKLRGGELIPVPGAEQHRAEREEKDLIAKFLEEWADEE